MGEGRHSFHTSLALQLLRLFLTRPTVDSLNAVPDACLLRTAVVPAAHRNGRRVLLSGEAASGAPEDVDRPDKR